MTVPQANLLHKKMRWTANIISVPARKFLEDPTQTTKLDNGDASQIIQELIEIESNLSNCNFNRIAEHSARVIDHVLLTYGVN